MILKRYFKTSFQIFKPLCRHVSNKNVEFIEVLDSPNPDYEHIANKCFTNKQQNCFIIHPYIKWGPKKKLDISKHNELQEAESLVNTLNGWKVLDKLIIPVENMNKRTIFGTGSLEKLKQQIRSNNNITAVFINIGTIKNKQIVELESIFGVPILDRYKIVMQILKQHAKTKHAKLQVALAEISYLRSKLKYVMNTNWKLRDKMLQEREVKLKSAIQKLRNQRELLRNKRIDLNYPVVAFVGYTNVGKTSLIKCLTGDKNLQPINQLFATLDVTIHAGFLPSKLEVLYVDTVGFITEIPTNLIECFIATLEDALLADVIVHVIDVSSKNMIHQRNHVDSVLKSLAQKLGTEYLENKIINVGNKADLIKSTEHKDLILVSAKKHTGLEELKKKIESVVLENTNRHIVFLEVPSGGDEMRWLFKNSTVLEQAPADKPQFQVMKIIITLEKLKQFEKYFVVEKK